MTTAFMEDVASAPDDVFDGAEFEENKPRTRTRERQCEKCETVFTGGTKLCPDCRGTKPKTPRGNSSAKLQEELLESYVSLATEVAIAAPTVSGVLIARAESTIDGMMSLANGHPKVMAALRKTAKVSKLVDVLQTIVLIVVAAAVDFGRIPADSYLLDTLATVEIKRENGKPVKDEQGKYVKNRTTLRDIYDAMHPSQDDSGGTPFANMGMAPNGFMPHDTGTGPTTTPPMNWIPRAQ